MKPSPFLCWVLFITVFGGCSVTTDDCPYCLWPDNIRTRTMLYYGNEWTYRVEQWNENASLFSTDTLNRVLRGTENIFASSDTVEISDNGDTSRSTLAYVSPTDYGEELYVISNANTPNPLVILFLRDLHRHQVYLLRDSQYVQSGDTLIDRQVLTEINDDTLITVPVGRFHCVHFKRVQYGGNYKAPERRYSADFFLGKFTGMVLEIDSTMNNAGTGFYKVIERSMIAYRVK